jgi:N-acyl amino acid synthase of PEP-CTERM/exosortase system
MDKNAIANTFSKYFFAVLATTPELRETAYRIRYQVYCQEFQFEPEANCPGHKEQDEYDEQSVHGLLMHRPSGAAIGCLRLVLPHPDDPALPLPFERHCRHALNPDRVDIDSLDRQSIGEVSRLAVIPQFRRRKSDLNRPLSFPDPVASAKTGRDTFPLIPVSLFLIGMCLFLDSKLGFAFAMMEPYLASLLSHHGIRFTPAGEVVDYHGQRGPFLLTRETALSHFTPEVQALLHVINQQLCPVSTRNAA